MHAYPARMALLKIYYVTNREYKIWSETVCLHFRVHIALLWYNMQRPSIALFKWSILTPLPNISAILSWQVRSRWSYKLLLHYGLKSSIDDSTKIGHIVAYLFKLTVHLFCTSQNFFVFFVDCRYPWADTGRWCDGRSVSQVWPKRRFGLLYGVLGQ